MTFPINIWKIIKPCSSHHQSDMFHKPMIYSLVTYDAPVTSKKHPLGEAAKSPDAVSPVPSQRVRRQNGHRGRRKARDRWFGRSLAIPSAHHSLRVLPWQIANYDEFKRWSAGKKSWNYRKYIYYHLLITYWSPDFITWFEGAREGYKKNTESEQIPRLAGLVKFFSKSLLEFLPQPPPFLASLAKRKRAKISNRRQYSWHVTKAAVWELHGCWRCKSTRTARQRSCK